MSYTIEGYLDWITDEAPQYLPKVRKIIKQAEEKEAEGFTGTCWYSDSILDAIWADVWGILRWGHRPYALERRIAKRRRAAAKAAETKRRNAARYGPGRDRHGHLRDSQRSKVYAAERAALAKFASPPFATHADAQGYVDRLLASAWWKRRWPEVRKVKIKTGRGCYSSGGSITLNSWGLTQEYVILHELAHEIIWATIGHTKTPAHGRDFCRFYLELVGHKMGEADRKALKAAFQEGKVKHTKARPPMSEEQRAAAAERLAVARTARAS